MEKGRQTQIIPEMVIIPMLDKVERLVQGAGHFINRLISFCPLEAPDYMSNHFTHPLDEVIVQVPDWRKPGVEPEPVDNSQPELPFPEYEANGSYYFKDKSLK